jgi:hypothetical protein
LKPNEGPHLFGFYGSRTSMGGILDIYPI